MQPKQSLLIHIINGLVVLLSGCSSGSIGETANLPEVNNANCKPEIIAAIESKSAQKKFAGLCAKKSSFKKSPLKSWGPGDL